MVINCACVSVARRASNTHFKSVSLKLVPNLFLQNIAYEIKYYRLNAVVWKTCEPVLCSLNYSADFFAHNDSDNIFGVFKRKENNWNFVVHRKRGCRGVHNGEML